MSDEADQADTSNKVVIQPSRPWPVYSEDKAKLELIALELLTQGVSQYRIRIQTKLSSKEIRRLAAVVAEDAKKPPTPRIVGRSPRPSRPIPAAPAGPPARAPRTAVIRPTRRGHVPTCPAARAETPVEPEQMTFAFD
ncbi:hypothetical protein ACH41H_24985 [Streptomyces sp. NPDC020800]|uniref:hypothetical protein n=1 Tax=Streptomyces sp. NPDC020800 TaxID=3365092 RepID=UPI0037A25406